MKPWTERRLALAHITLAAREREAPGPKVLALHGWLDNAASFDALAPQLPMAHIVAPDFAGHGRSEHRPLGAWYHLIDHLSEIDALLDQLGWRNVILLGHSMGGALACLYAAARPARVDALWLIEGLGPISAEATELPAQIGRALAERGASAGKALRVFASVDEALAVRCAATPMAPAGARPLIERALKEKSGGGWSWSSDPRLRLTSPLRMTELQVEAALRAIACPTLLISATATQTWYSPEAMARRIACVPQIEHRVLSGNHHLHIDSPHAVGAVIVSFHDTATAEQADQSAAHS